MVGTYTKHQEEVAVWNMDYHNNILINLLKLLPQNSSFFYAHFFIAGMLLINRKLIMTQSKTEAFVFRNIFLFVVTSILFKLFASAKSLISFISKRPTP